MNPERIQQNLADIAAETRVDWQEARRLGKRPEYAILPVFETLVVQEDRGIVIPRCDEEFPRRTFQTPLAAVFKMDAAVTSKRGKLLGT
jgi:hypothetical protein